MKCLEKAPKNRYSTAQELADDLNRWLAGKPILARPASTTERISKYIRRHPAISVLLGLLVLTMTTGSGGIIWQWRQAVAARVELAGALTRSKQNEDEALRSEDLARHLAYAAKLTLAARDWQDANVAEVRRQLDETRPPPRKTDLRGFEWHYLDRLTRSQGQTLIGHEKATAIWSVAYSPDGRRLASAGDDRTIKVWDTSTGQAIHTLVANEQVLTVAFHPGGARLASAGGRSEGGRSDGDPVGRRHRTGHPHLPAGSHQGDPATGVFARRQDPRLHQPGWYREALGFRRRLTDSHPSGSPRRHVQPDRLQPRRQDPPLGRRR